MNESHREIIRAGCRPLQPIATGETARLETLVGLRAVLFDVYGTLLISASGEVGTVDEQVRGQAVQQALAAAGWRLEGAAGDAAQALVGLIQDAHGQARDRGIDTPEVDMVAIWRKVLAQLIARGQLPPEASDTDCALVATHYEVRVNPTWPMPGMVACLERLVGAQCVLGIVSNAQFYTPHLFPGLVDRTLDQLGFDAQLQIFSYQLQWAKPSPVLFQHAAAVLARRGIAPEDVLYVGNDLLNDIAGAQYVGFRTALFAGDARSLRWRGGDPRTDGVRPDLVVTELAQVADCVSARTPGREG